MPLPTKGTRVRLTGKLIAATHPDPNGGIRRLWDDKEHELHVVVYPSGRKSYVVAYKANRRERRVTLGDASKLTPDDARSKCRTIMGGVEKGTDPLAERDKAKEQIALGDFWREHFLPDATRRWKPSTREGMVRLFDLHVFPALKSRKLADLSRADVAQLHRKIGERSKYEANRTLALLKSMWNRADDWGFVEGSNPCRRVKPFAEHARERFLSPAEIKRVWDAIAEEEAVGGKKGSPRPSAEELAEIERELIASGIEIKRRKDGTLDRRHLAEKVTRGISTHAAGLFRLLMLTGCRLGEIQTAQWAFVDFDKGWLDLPDSKTGKKRVALPTAALEELCRLHGLRTQDKWIIEGDRAGSYLVNAQKPWRRVRTRAGLEDVRIHDLRHSFASVAILEGVPLMILGKSLGHKQARTTERYSHLAADPIRQAVELISARIVDAAKTGGAEVVDVAKQQKAGAK